MVARQTTADVVNGLRSSDQAVRLTSAKTIKNRLAGLHFCVLCRACLTAHVHTCSVIGNKGRKLSYLQHGALQHLVGLLSSEDPQLLVQAAAAVGSFACGADSGLLTLDRPCVGFCCKSAKDLCYPGPQAYPISLFCACVQGRKLC